MGGVGEGGGGCASRLGSLPLKGRRLEKVVTEGTFVGDEAEQEKKAAYAHSYGFSTRLPSDIGPVAIAAGGPSLKDSLGALHGTKARIIACNGAHDYLINNGIIPWACLIMDTCEESWRVLKEIRNGRNLRPETPVKYLIASQVHYRLIDLLVEHDCDVRIWDFMGEVDASTAPICSRAENGRFYAALGSTVALQAILMAYNMGSRDIDVYGMDSCYIGEEHHAYQYDREVEEATEVAYRSQVRFGEGSISEQPAKLIPREDGRPLMANPIACGEKTFFCEPSMLLQAQDFQKIIKVIGASADIRVHGPGLIAEIMREGERIASEKLKHVPEGLR